MSTNHLWRIHADLIQALLTEYAICNINVLDLNESHKTEDVLVFYPFICNNSVIYHASTPRHVEFLWECGEELLRSCFFGK